MILGGQKRLYRLVYLAIALIACVATGVPAQEPSASYSEAADVRAAEREGGFADWLAGRQQIIFDRTSLLTSEIGSRVDVNLTEDSAERYRALLTRDVAPIARRIRAAQQNYGGLVDSVSSKTLSWAGFNRRARALESSVVADMDVWNGKIDVVRGQLRSSGTPRQDARMFERAFDLASVYFNDGDYAAAMVLLNDILTTYRGLAPVGTVRFYLGECSYALLHRSEAEKQYRKSIDAPLPRGASAQMRKIAGDAFLNWLELAFAGQKYSAIDRLWKTGPTLPASPSQYTRAHLLVAESYLNLGKARDARRVLDRISNRTMPSQDDPKYDPVGQERALMLLDIYAELLRAESKIAQRIGAGPAPRPMTRRPSPKPQPVAVVASASVEPDTSLVAVDSLTMGVDGSDIEVDSLGVASADSAGGIGILGAELAAIHQATTETKVDLSGLSGLGMAPMDFGADLRRMGGPTAYDVASTVALTKKGAQSHPSFDAGIGVLSSLKLKVEAGDFEEFQLPLLDRISISLGHANFQRERFTEAESHYSQVSPQSAYFTLAQLGRAWSYAEMHNYSQALLIVNDLQNFPMPPHRTLETAVLRAQMLQKTENDSLAAAQVEDLEVWSTVDQRRAVAAMIRRQVASIRIDLQAVALLALDQQRESVYTGAMKEQRSLAALADTAQAIEAMVQSTLIRSVVAPSQSLAARIRRENDRWDKLRSDVARLRRQVGPRVGLKYDRPGDLQRRYMDLQEWLNRIDPRVQNSNLQKWLRYASFAYAKQPFEENQRRREEATRLKNDRARIEFLLSGGR